MGRLRAARGSQRIDYLRTRVRFARSIPVYHSLSLLMLSPFHVTCFVRRASIMFVYRGREAKTEGEAGKEKDRPSLRLAATLYDNNTRTHTTHDVWKNHEASRV